MREEKSGYVRAPEVPKAGETAKRYEAVLRVMQGELTVTEAAELLGMSRNRFQAVMHRSEAGMIEGAMKKKPGRPRKPERESELEAEVARLRAENEKLRRFREVSEELLGAASDLLRGRLGIRPKGRGKSEAERGGGGPDEADPAGRAGWFLRAARALGRFLGTPALAARALHIGASTVRRLDLRERKKELLVMRRGPGPKAAPATEVRERVAAIVRSTEGLEGAEALRRKVPEVSRRDAAAIKAETESAMERARKAAAVRVIVTVPGIVRGFDGMHVRVEEGARHLLVAADGSVPYRTSAVLVERYDAGSVAEALERDFAENGAPVVLRLDRAKAHQDEQVRELLTRWGVLALAGPARYAPFYGQLERQNREHRAWMARWGVVASEVLRQEIGRMMIALSGVWRRARLGWKTATEVWMARPELVVDRARIADEVARMTEKIGRELAGRGESAAQASRFAVEAMLTQMGWLRRETGGFVRSCG